jgi:D-alanyl-D-alanine carboxypeptidase
LQTYLTSRTSIEHISAASLSLSLGHDPTPINIAVGTTQDDGGAAVTPSNLFQIGSNTKAFTAVTLLQLEADGKLTIKQTLGDWLPQYPAWKDVTIERLLNMTSGIPTYDNVQAMQIAYAANPTKDWSPADLIAFVYPTTKGAPPPTTGWSYSNTNYLLAQLIIEKASGHSYGDELRRRFFNNIALRLRDTFYASHLYPPAVTTRMVSGYFASKDPDNAGLQPLYGKDMRDFSASWAQAAGAIVASPADVGRWSRARYVGDLLKPQQRRELMSLISAKTGQPISKVTPDDPRGFGLGVVRALLPPIGKFWFYEGETLGYRVAYAWFPETDTVIVVALNSQPDSKEDHIGKLIEAIHATLQKAGAL